MPFKLGLLGRKLGHSLSPQIHAAFLEAASLSGTYQKLECEPESVADPDFIKGLEDQGFDGLNITIPYKSDLLDRLGSVDGAATRCGAVNTLCRGAAPYHWSGLNTDIGGVIDALALLPLSLEHDFVVIGAGGAARAALISLESIYKSLGKSLSLETTVMVRDLQGEKAQKMREFVDTAHLAMPVRIVACKDGCKINGDKNPRLLINATPIGQTSGGQPDVPDWLQEVLQSMQSGDCLMDMVYALDGMTPIVKALEDLKQAKGLTIHAIDGLPMLIAQAALAFETWTGCRADRQAALAALKTS